MKPTCFFKGAVEVGREAGFGAGDPKISHQGQAQSTTHSSPLNGRHDRFAARKNPDGFEIQRIGAWIFRAADFVVRAVEIGTCTKRSALRRQHNGPTLRVLIQGFKGIGDLLDQLKVEKIVRRAANFHQGHMLVVCDAQIGGGAHGVVLSCGG
jgi:hypothetical protein